MEKENHWDNIVLDRIRKEHDVCKENPFWKTISKDFHTDCVNELKLLIDDFIGVTTVKGIDKCPPHTMLLLQVYHNLFDAMLKAKLSYKNFEKNIVDTSAIGNYILYLQTALQIIHYYLDGIFDEDEVVIYEPMLYWDEEKDDYICQYKTYGVRKNEDETYRIVRIIREDEYKDVLKFEKERLESYTNELERMLNTYGEREYKSFTDSLKKKIPYFMELVESLINRDNKHFVIK